MAQDRIPTWQLAAFAGPAVPMAAMGLPISVYLPQFYAEQMGLGLAAVGTVFMIARLWDVITDPMMGIISDKFPSRWGRRRHWIVGSVPIILVSAVMVYMPSAPSSSLYLFGWMFILYIGYTMAQLNHMAWGAELHEDYDERSRIMGFLQGAAIFGVPVVLLIPVLIEQFGTDDVAADRVAAMGWFLIVLLPITVAVAAWRVPEIKTRTIKQELPLRDAVRPLLTNRPLQRVIASDFLSGFSGAALGSMFLFQVTYVLQIGAPSILLLIYFFAGLGFVPVVVKLSYRLGKHQALIAAALFNALMVPTLFLIPPGNFYAAAAIFTFLGVNVGSVTILYRSILADVVDVDELETGHRRTGQFYALMTLTSKTGGAIAVGVVFWTLSLIGFVPGAENTESAIRGLSIVFVATPMICNFGVAAIMWGFPLDKDMQEGVRRQLEERAKTADAAPASD
ncbi:MAG: MFS transporter [Parvibaculaceae bacterium]|nr:MFS transporter [Parvibaculaceae bacterium]HBM89422.1 MFS transporter [Rhodobiaceae bacterium]